jgi:hypothetical protein
VISIGYAFTYKREFGFNLPRKKSFRKKMRNINSNCMRQNSLRSKFKKIIPLGMKNIEDNVYGVDYDYNGLTIDQKFSFGDLGKNTIKIRAKKRKLVNKSDWTLCIDEYGDIEMFPTYKLAEFVNKNWGMVAKGRIEKRKDYTSYRVRLDDFYRVENIVCFKTTTQEEEFFSTLNEISNINYKEKYEENNYSNFTILDKFTNEYSNIYPSSLKL